MTSCEACRADIDDGAAIIVRLPETKGFPNGHDAPCCDASCVLRLLRRFLPPACVDAMADNMASNSPKPGDILVVKISAGDAPPAVDVPEGYVQRGAAISVPAHGRAERPRDSIASRRKVAAHKRRRGW